MSSLFPHLDLRTEQARLLSLLRESTTALVYHGDCDGLCSVALAHSIAASSGRADAQAAAGFRVDTQDLDLGTLIDWIGDTSPRNVVIFDINLSSSPRRAEELPEIVPGIILSVDDHIWDAKRSRPSGIQFVDLISAENTGPPNATLRPPFLFMYELLGYGRKTSAFEDCLALMGMYGEGVSHLFGSHLPTGSRATLNAIRDLAWGVNAYFTDQSVHADDHGLLSDLTAASDDSLTSLDAVVKGLTGSAFGKAVSEARKIVDKQVRQHAVRIESGSTWATTNSGLPVYLIEVESSRRIVNLVASNARNRIPSGLVIAVQRAPTSVSIELRRTRDLDSPDLARVLYALDSTMFLSRGGHPMASGATVKTEFDEELLGQLHRVLTQSV